ncbi:unnamed protein product [Zymoseptoria tritici ST99CH_1A5]|uniref:Uncharacterized protein n=3 Tax=Zymoseptoria tritici TaxID=1047171 RepID=A0A1X7S7V9_ZYMT9|nr:unnamed protein product [Zymoseptoria tritici ST99CH_3D7]SMR60914.1 unnamed protein product [Zymoseptoria tritici ST99CH_1E4]SMY29407.1 unnamed protein product [Zymoseptoria tritici ST99CH_1A5]
MKLTYNVLALALAALGLAAPIESGNALGKPIPVIEAENYVNSNEKRAPIQGTGPDYISYPTEAEKDEVATKNKEKRAPIQGTGPDYVFYPTEAEKDEVAK